MPWENLGDTGDPGSGKGFESAVAYAVADKLGFAKDKVTWVVVPFTNVFAPGAKDFDFYQPGLLQHERTEAVDLSDGYYNLNQAVVARRTTRSPRSRPSPSSRTSSSGRRSGTTSYDAIVNVIVPTTDPSVYDTNDAALEALKAKQIDALVVDLPTADFNVNVQIEDSAGTIVGQLEPFGGTPSTSASRSRRTAPLTACVNAAIAALQADGTLDALATQWLPFQETVPVLK